MESPPDFGDLGAAFADDTANDLVGDGHLVGLVGVGTTATSSAGWNKKVLPKKSAHCILRVFAKVRVCLR